MKKKTPYRKCSALSLPELETQISDFQSAQIESHDPIEKLMTQENSDGLRVVELCLNILFEEDDEMYIIYLIENVPNIKKYLHHVNKSNGWLPIFRVLNIFQNKDWETEKTNEKYKKADKLLKALINIDYDFLKKSKFKIDSSDYLSTLEVMMTSIVDTTFFRRILDHLWVSQPHQLANFLQQVVE